MGVVNLTPDSFRPETRAMSLEAAKARIADLVARGCSIIDFGAVSTRPGAADVPVEEEWRRLEPVLRHVRRMGIPSPTALTAGADEIPSPAAQVRNDSVFHSGGIACHSEEAKGRRRNLAYELWHRQMENLPPISVDTTSAEIVRRAYALVGRFLVNDISAGEDDPEMLETVAKLGLPYVAMHKRGNPRSMDALTDYPQGVVKAVDEYFEVFAEKAERLGIRDWILDPGFGFAKTAEQNWELLENLPALRHFGRPILVGVADKRFTHTPNPFVSTIQPVFVETTGKTRVVSTVQPVFVETTGKTRVVSTIQPVSVETSGSDYAERLAAERGANVLRIH